MNFQGKVAVITGSAAGIGRATAITFAKNGASVALIDINESGVRETASLIQDSGGQVLPLCADVAVESEVSGAFEQLG
jgi:NAD(P)-dependent dehydrogenase (short-subunit alcohol dehydrogenase family)